MSWRDASLISSAFSTWRFKCTSNGPSSATAGRGEAGFDSATTSLSAGFDSATTSLSLLDSLDTDTTWLDTIAGPVSWPTLSAGFVSWLTSLGLCRLRFLGLCRLRLLGLCRLRVLGLCSAAGTLSAGCVSWVRLASAGRATGKFLTTSPSAASVSIVELVELSP